MAYDRAKGQKFSRKERPRNRSLERKSILDEDIIIIRNKGALVGVRVGRILVKFRVKSHYQQNDCISCPHDSYIEAVYKTASVRCCEDEACMKRAAKLAVIGG
jgi:hypothetical protein